MEISLYVVTLKQLMICVLALTLSVMSQSGSLDKLSINTPKPVGFKVLGVEAPLRIYLLKPLSLTQFDHKHLLG